MSLKRAPLVLVLFLAILSGCTNQDVPDHSDWCWRYDFTLSDYTVNLIAGQYVEGRGLETDETGQLIVNYTNNITVQPSVILITAARRDGVVGDIDVAASADIFGVDISFNETLPAIAGDTAVLPFVPEDTTSIGNSFNITLEASQTVDLQVIEVRGNGVNPFPYNSCDELETPTNPPQTPAETGTPTPATPTPSDTVTPTPTATGSPMPTATPNNTCWQFFYCDPFDGGQFGAWSAPDPNYPGSWKMDSGHKTAPSRYGGPSWGLTVVTFPAPVCLYGMGMYDTNTANSGQRRMIAYVGSTAVLGGTSSSDNAHSWQYFYYQVTSSCIPNVTSIVFGGSSGGSRYYDDLLVNAEWMTPPTSTPTRTLTPSSTPLPTETGTPTLTKTATITRTPSRTPIVVASPGGTATITSSPAPATLPASTTPFPTRTLIPSVTPFPTWQPTDPANPGEPDPDAPPDYGEGILGSINDFFNWLVNTFNNFGDWLGSIFSWIRGAAANVGTLINNLIGLLGALLNLALQILGDIWAIFGLILSILRLIIELLWSWLGQLIARAQAVIMAWYMAPPTPIPSLPHCLTQPMGSDICAFYYVMDNTILSGAIGGLIVPLMTLIMDVAIVLYFIRTARNLLRKAGSVEK